MPSPRSLSINSFLSKLLNSKNESLASYKSLDFFKDDFLASKISKLDKDRHPTIYDLATCYNSSQLFDLSNRKFLGSKDNLIDFIEDVITSEAGTEIEAFLDAFAGTGVVAARFRKYSSRVITNDILYSNYIANTAFLCSTRKTVSIKKVRSLILHLNEMKPAKGYLYKNYGGTYFTHENASLLDSMREEIEHFYSIEECSLQERSILLASLIYAADKVANTVGQYDAFLKGIGSACYIEGKHKTDSNVYNRVLMKRPLVFFDGSNISCHGDINQLASRIEAEVVYLDPPYNNRQYVDCYHVLENICSWKQPLLYGKTRKFQRSNLKSLYCTKRSALAAFQDLVSKLRCRHIFLSYNSEGIISDEDILSTLRKRGKTQIFQKDYNVFGNGAGVSRKRMVKERIFHCRVK